MLLKEQKDKFSFLALDEDEDEERRRARRGGEGAGARQGAVAEGAEPRRGQEEVTVEEGAAAETEPRRKGERKRGRGPEGRKSPASAPPSASAATPTSHALPPEEPPPRPSSPLEMGAVLQEEESEGLVDTHGQTGARTPPYNGQGQVRSYDTAAGSDFDLIGRDELLFMS